MSFVRHLALRALRSGLHSSHKSRYCCQTFCPIFTFTRLTNESASCTSTYITYSILTIVWTFSIRYKGLFYKLTARTTAEVSVFKNSKTPRYKYIGTDDIKSHWRLKERNRIFQHRCLFELTTKVSGISPEKLANGRVLSKIQQADPLKCTLRRSNVLFKQRNVRRCS